MEQKVQEAPAVSLPVAWIWRDTVIVTLFLLLLLLAVTVQTGRVTMILSAAALLAALPLGKAPLNNLRARLSIPVLGLLLLALMEGLAAIYSPFDSSAAPEYYKFLAAFSLAVMLLTRIEKKHIRALIWGLAGICALISLMSIDSVGSTVLYGAFAAIVEFFGGSFTIELTQARVNGIYNDANVTAYVLALGMLLSFYLIGVANKWWERIIACCFLGVSAMGFLLSMSRGAILCFGVAMLLWLITAGKGNRLPLFFRAVFAAGAALLLSAPAMSAVGTGSALPTLLTLLAGPIIYLLEWLLVSRFSCLVEKNFKVVAVAAGVLAVACVGYAVAALTVTGPYTIGEEGAVARIVSLKPGFYTVSGDWDGDPHFSVNIMKNVGSVESDWENVYYGPASEVSFEIPEDTQRVRVLIAAEPGTELRTVVFSDGTAMKLDYLLLPKFIVDRMDRGLFSSSSFSLRVQFMKDAWTIFKKSPIIGHGLGSTEGLYRSVQPFFYESLYVHNHILQVMDDIGLLGLIGFLALLLGSGWLLLKNLRSETGDLAAMLLACWVMINTHSLMEINFSVRASMCISYVLLVLPVVLYEKPLAKQTVVRWGGLAVAVFLWVYLAVFWGLLESHRMVQRDAAEFSSNSISEYMNTLKSYVRRDVFDREDYQLMFVANAVPLNSSNYNRELRLYAEDLRDSGTYSACSGLAKYYYLPRGEYEEMFASSREGIAQLASFKDVWNMELEFYRTDVLSAMKPEDMDVYVDGVLALKTYLETYSQGRLEEIELTEENQQFLDAVTSVREVNMPDADAYVYLNAVMGYGQDGAEQ